MVVGVLLGLPDRRSEQALSVVRFVLWWLLRGAGSIEAASLGAQAASVAAIVALKGFHRHAATRRRHTLLRVLMLAAQCLLNFGGEAIRFLHG